MIQIQNKIEEHGTIVEQTKKTIFSDIKFLFPIYLHSNYLEKRLELTKFIYVTLKEYLIKLFELNWNKKFQECIESVPFRYDQIHKNWLSLPNGFG